MSTPTVTALPTTDSTVPARRRWAARAAAAVLAAGALAVVPVASASAACEESTSRSYDVIDSTVVPAGSFTVGPSTGTVTQAVTAGTTVSETSSITGEVSGSAGFDVGVFSAEASASLGVGYSQTATIEAGTSTTFEFPPSSTDQTATWGIQLDDIMITENKQQSGCNVIVSQSYGELPTNYAQIVAG